MSWQTQSSQDVITHLPKQLFRQLICATLQRCNHSLILVIHSGNVILLHLLPLATPDGGLSIELLAHLLSLLRWEMFDRHTGGALWWSRRCWWWRHVCWIGRGLFGKLFRCKRVWDERVKKTLWCRRRLKWDRTRWKAPGVFCFVFVRDVSGGNC